MRHISKWQAVLYTAMFNKDSAAHPAGQDTQHSTYRPNQQVEMKGIVQASISMFDCDRQWLILNYEPLQQLGLTISRTVCLNHDCKQGPW